MTIRELAEKAVKQQDVKAAAKLADFCRFRLGMNYIQTYQLVNQACPVSLQDWEALMYEADWMEGHG